MKALTDKEAVNLTTVQNLIDLRIAYRQGY